MEWFERLNNSLDYIEENLEGNLSYEKAAQIACCSINHYQRMFSFISNTTLAEYIRKRRLTKASFELQNSNKSVLDISLKYCYNSPTAFTRAFISVHGVNPTEARKMGTALKLYPKISFQVSVKGESELVYRIEEKEEFKIIGIKESISNDGIYNLERIPLMWEEARESGKFDNLASSYNEKFSGMMGICANFESDKFDYYIGVVSNQKTNENMSELMIEKQVWAIFECVGLNTIQATWKRIFTEWFPSSKYEVTEAPEIEWYPASDSKADVYKTEIWIPIRKQVRSQE